MNSALSDFAPTTSKRKTRRNKYVVPVKTVDNHIEDMKINSDLLSDSLFYKTFVTNLDTFKAKLNFEKSPFRIGTLRCLALGSPTDSINAMYQLAILNLVLKHLDIDPKNVSVWDPVISDDDKELFKSLGYAVTEDGPENTHDKEKNDSLQNRSENDFVCFYMMHSPPWLTEQVLRTNENSKFMIIGNNLTSYSNHLSAQELKDKYPFIASAIEDIEGPLEIPIVMGNKRKSAKQKNKPIENTKPLNQVWDFFPIPDSHSRNDAWMSAVNDTSVYWKKEYFGLVTSSTNESISGKDETDIASLEADFEKKMTIEVQL